MDLSIHTRAKESSVLVIYGDKPDLIKETLLSKQWFTEDEINSSVLQLGWLNVMMVPEGKVPVFLGLPSLFVDST